MIDLIVVLTLITLGYFVGSHLEKKHYISIREREAEYASLPTVMLKNPLHPELVKESRLVNGSVVISIDYFKRLMAAFRNIFGGNVSSYESLVDRARREAILRMKEDAKGSDEIINLRIETASISKNDRKGSIGSVEVLAYGTALRY
ncbi:MAG: heavy metal-binding domain-containing protein [Sulfurimonadaceae bacterium]